MGSLKVQKCSSTVSTPDLTTVCSFGILKTRRGREGKEGLTKLIYPVRTIINVKDQKKTMDLNES